MSGAANVKPLLFLDVDGVLNLLGAVGINPDLRQEHLVFRGTGGWRQGYVTLDRRHPALLDQLAIDFELTWATAWQHNANAALIELLGLPTLPVVEFGHDCGRDTPPTLHWKTSTLARYAGERPFCWIDDESSAADQKWFADRGLRTLVVTTDPSEGLGEREVLSALDFAARLEGSMV